MPLYSQNLISLFLTQHPKIMKPIFSLVFSLLLFLTTGCIKDEKGDERIHVKDKLPAFTTVELSDQPVDSDTLLKGNVSLIVFFNSTCGDCQRELPKIEELWKTLKDEKNFRLMAISRGETKSVISDFIVQQHLTMPVYLDPKKEAFLLFADKTVPRIYLADKNGIVRYIAIERIDITTDQLKEKIKELL